MSAGDWLSSRTARTPDAPALSLSGRDFTWSELAREVSGIGATLEGAGVGPGDVVATLTGSGDFARVLHAIWQRGATVLPLNLRLTTPEVVFQLQDAGARFLVHGPDALEARAAEIAKQIPAVGLLRPEVGPGQGGHGALHADPEVPAAILYTSGTTGSPKGAILGADNLEASAGASRERLESRPGDRGLACMPLFHVGGLSMLVRSVLLGSCVVVQEGFEPGLVARSLDEDGITDVSFVANMLARVMDARGDCPAPPSLRSVLVGGGPIPEPLLRRAAAAGWPVAHTYGLTEAASQVATRAPRDVDATGLRALRGIELRIDARGAPTGVGEILVRGANVMRGYLGRPEESARTLRDGWLHTGDIGQLHPDGTISVLDRRKDLIVSGGENVYPAEIESVLSGHPGVAEVGVAGRADERFGQRPVAWFVPATSPAVGADELIAFCRERLAAFKVPVTCHPVDALPRTSSGKLMRARLTEAAGSLS